MTSIYSRRLLLHTPLPVQSPTPCTTLSDSSMPELGTSENSFDSKVVMILAILVCALICALGVNSMVRCALKFSARAGLDPEVGHIATKRIRRKALKAIPVFVFSPELKINGSDPQCVICISDLVAGERVRVLPRCGHVFHVKCIDKWIVTHPSCPNCRECLFDTDLKSSGSANVSSVGVGNNASVVHSIIVPLGPEGYVDNYRGDS